MVTQEQAGRVVVGGAGMTCPACDKAMQRLQGRDGYRVDFKWDMDRRSGAVVGRKSLDVVYACSGCEYVSVGRTQ